VESCLKQILPFISRAPECDINDVKLFRFTGISREQGQSKAVLLQAWSGPEGSRKLRFPDFMTTAQDGGKVVSLTHRPPLSPGL